MNNAISILFDNWQLFIEWMITVSENDIELKQQWNWIFQLLMQCDIVMSFKPIWFCLVFGKIF